MSSVLDAIKQVAHWYRSRNVTTLTADELVAAGMVSAWRAATRFDATRGSFWTYARPRVIGGMADEVRWHNRTHTVNRRIDYMLSLDAMADDGAEPGATDDALEASDARHDVGVLLRACSPKHARAVLLCLSGMTYAEAGVTLGVTESRVAQIMRRAVDDMCYRAGQPKANSVREAVRP